LNQATIRLELVMDPREFFRGFFGLSRGDPRFFGEQPGQSYGSGDDEDDEECDDCRRYPPSQYFLQEGFDVFTNPLDMERFFNHRMEEMMRGFFGGVLLPPGMGQPPQMPGLGRPMPPPGILEQEDDDESSAGSRDFMLRDGYVKRRAGATGQDEKWEDGEIDIGQVDKVVPAQPPVMPPTPFRGLFSADPFFNGQAPSGPEIHTFSFGQSSSSSFVSRPDGSTEERKTTTDSQGNVRTTVKRCLGDQCQVTTTVKKSDGTEERSESTANMDQSEAEEFDARWRRGGGSAGGMQSPNVLPPPWGGQTRRREHPRDEMLKRNEEQNSSLFNRFFGSD